MQTQAPEGQYRVIGLDDEARDLADRNGDSYAWLYVYDDAGELLYEGGCHAQFERIQKLNQEAPGENKTQR